VTETLETGMGNTKYAVEIENTRDIPLEKTRASQKDEVQLKETENAREKLTETENARK
jgi:hypothetical protein